jgi:hypothetical protein
MSPARKSPSATRSTAIAISSSAASIPATLAPPSAAMRAKRPAPHPQSSTRLPEPISARSSTCAYTGVPQPARPSHVSAHAAARAPNSGPHRVALPAAIDISDTSSAFDLRIPMEAPDPPSDPKVERGVTFFGGFSARSGTSGMFGAELGARELGRLTLADALPARPAVRGG